MTARTVRIGGASGFWGDSAIATPQLLQVPGLQYLVYDYLAETTMAILARARAKDAAEALDAAVNEALMTDILLADTAKEGPLAGIAKTSKAYDIALSARRTMLCTADLAHLFADAARLRTDADNARMALDKAQIQFSGIKHACDLKAMILRASVL